MSPAFQRVLYDEGGSVSVPALTWENLEGSTPPEGVKRKRLAGMPFVNDVVVVGGCGHVGLPLGLAFADRGLKVALLDVNQEAVDLVMSGTMPFMEDGASDVLTRVVGRELHATADSAVVSSAENVVVVIGTPIDEHLNPDPNAVLRAVDELREHLVVGQLLVLRSTLYPGTTALIDRIVSTLNKQIDVAFCPERIAEGRAMTELFELPQIVSGRTEHTVDRAEKLFRNLATQMVRMTPEEAELAKLFTNTWRYIKFATANQLYMMANDFGLDYERIRLGLTFDYPRAADLPSAGFAAGPCLLKDTMQLAAFNNNNFHLGHAAMMVNEGLPLYLVSKIEEQHDLSELTVGILGMAFKAESDDIRSSLSYKLKRILRFKAARVLCHDPYVSMDPDLVPLDTVLEQSDLIIVATPHHRYAEIVTTAQVIDIWGKVLSGSLL
jgi:UDP-N-acetyl-D-mannosaminuronic acid dehydrogenase